MLPPDAYDDDPCFLYDLVRFAVQKKKLHPRRVWRMTLPELLMIVGKQEDKWLRANNAFEQRVNCILIDERRELLAKLTWQQKVELERRKLLYC